MTKVKTTDYLKTLATLTSGVAERQRQQNFAGFLHLLRHNHALRQLPFILELYSQQLTAEQGLLEVKVYYQAATRAATPPSAAIQKQLAQFITRVFPGAQPQFTYHPRPGLRAGYLIEAAGRQFDLSLEHQLQQFRQQLLQV